MRERSASFRVRSRVSVLGCTAVTIRPWAWAGLGLGLGLRLGLGLGLELELGLEGKLFS